MGVVSIAPHGAPGSHPLPFPLAARASAGPPSGRLLEIAGERRVELAQPSDRLLGLGGSMEDRGLVPAQDLHPVVDVGGVAVVKFVGQAEFGAKAWPASGVAIYPDSPALI